MSVSTSVLSENSPSPRPRLREVGQMLHSEGIFTGGPPEHFEIAGRLQLATLLREGVYPQSKVLDVGCGCLRGGYWLIHFLDRGRYFGIEPSAFMLQKGIQHVLEPEVREEKQPRFDSNDSFDFSVFGEKMDVVLARSIWTHASKAQVQTMLDGFAANSSPEAFFLTSYLPASFWSRRKRDYQGDQWKGKSHQSSEPGLVCHSFRWIKEQVEARGMFVRQLPDLIFNRQHWLSISRVGNQGQGSSHMYRFG
jgi:SAM-dependent methyltransferase